MANTLQPYEQLAEENAIWPWLDSDCMADETGEPDLFDALDECEDYEDDE
jgi:hypothetical protein